MSSAQELTDALSLANPYGNRHERTLADLKQKQRYGLSEKQVAFAIGLATQLRNPEPTVPAPSGKAQVFTGKIISAKIRAGFRGEPCIKITIRVDTADGHWIAWGSFPKALYRADVDGNPVSAEAYTTADLQALKDRIVAIKATLKPSSGPNSEPHFAIMERPSGAFVE